MDHVFDHCIGCPIEGGTKFLCLDGCFTSSRYKKKGLDQKQVFENHYILKDNENQASQVLNNENQDSQILNNENQDSQVIEVSCTSQFVALQNPQLKSKFTNFDETGHFGLACARHEVLLKIADMHSGEGFKYPDMLLKDYFKNKNGLPDQLNLYYDIMCR